MDIPIRYKIGGSIIVVAVAFAAGRYSNRVADVKTTTNEKTDTNIDTNKDTKKKTVIKQAPDGTKVTVITEETTTNTKKIQDETLSQQTSITSNKGILNVSALTGIDIRAGVGAYYGLSVSKEVFGPVTVGAFGMTNGIFGLSLGVNF